MRLFYSLLLFFVSSYAMDQPLIPRVSPRSPVYDIHTVAVTEPYASIATILDLVRANMPVEYFKFCHHSRLGWLYSTNDLWLQHMFGTYRFVDDEGRIDEKVRRTIQIIDLRPDLLARPAPGTARKAYLDDHSIKKVRFLDAVKELEGE